MDLDSSASGSGGAAAAAPWGTLEELLLVGAITRHGAGDWNVVACELQNRAKLFSMPASYFSPEACKSKFDALNGRYNGTNHRSIGRDKEPENHWPWFEEIRKRRVAQLKREVERHDSSILSLSQKLKRLKTERQNPQKQQQDAAAAAAVNKTTTQQNSLEKPDEELEVPVSEVKSPKADEPVAMVTEDEVPIPEQQEDAFVDAAVELPNEPPVEALQSIKENYGVVETPGQENSSEGTRDDLEETTTTTKPPPPQEEMDRDNGEELVHRKTSSKDQETGTETAAGQDKMEIDEVVADDGNNKPTSEPQVSDVPGDDEIQPLPGGKEAVEEQGPVDSSFVEPSSIGMVEGGSCQPDQPQEDSGSSRDKEQQIVETANISARDSVEDEAAKSGHIAIHIVAEPVDEPTEAGSTGGNSEEKEGSSNENSQQDAAGKQAAEEKTDESQVARVEKPEATSREDANSPASANENVVPVAAEGSASFHEQSKDEGTKDGDSQVEKSEACSRPGVPDETSPTSRRSKKAADQNLPPAMQAHLEWLKSLCDHKLGPMFLQRQESQDEPRYTQLIKQHIDLNMIKTRLEEGGYTSSLDFFRDVMLLFTNFIVYYPATSQEFNAASTLKKLALEEMEKYSKLEASTTKQEKPAVTRKRDTTTTRRNTDSNPTSSIPAPTTAPVSAVSPAPPTTTTTTTTKSGQMDISVSENSKSKSASVSLGVRSSRGGDEDDTREGGEPEVSGKSKPLRAYGRKNRASVSKVKESPLETIVKKEAAMAAAAKEVSVPPSTTTTTTGNITISKGRDKSGGTSSSRDKKQPSSDAVTKSASSKGRISAVSTPTTNATTISEGDLPAVTPRGARNKRSAKDYNQRTGKRSRRV